METIQIIENIENIETIDTIENIENIDFVDRSGGKEKAPPVSAGGWWASQDLNPGPSGYEPPALTS